jgi:hypothetical protein
VTIRELEGLLADYNEDTEVLGLGHGGELRVHFSDDDGRLYIEELG